MVLPAAPATNSTVISCVAVSGESGLIISGYYHIFMTKLVTWNCNMAFREKKDALLEHDPDILVIQECENPKAKGDWSEFSDWEWAGDNDNKGLAVFSRNDYSLELIDIEGHNCRYILPVRVMELFDVLGIWAMNSETNPEQRYIGQVYTALQQCEEFVDADTIIAGDFNWNIIWDESPDSAPLRGNFSDTVEILNDIGLRSSYHTLTDSEFGDEAKPTFFMHKKQDRPYHTDYLFLPDSLIGSVANFSVGSYEAWIAASDHMPIMIELEE